MKWVVNGVEKDLNNNYFKSSYTPFNTTAFSYKIFSHQFSFWSGVLLILIYSSVSIKDDSGFLFYLLTLIVPVVGGSSSFVKDISPIMSVLLKTIMVIHLIGLMSCINYMFKDPALSEVNTLIKYTTRAWTFCTFILALVIIYAVMFKDSNRNKS
jgi:hypothetical protein